MIGIEGRDLYGWNPLRERNSFLQCREQKKSQTKNEKTWSRRDLNPRPLRYQHNALPTELRDLPVFIFYIKYIYNIKKKYTFEQLTIYSIR